jgi:hypothetical protein
MAECRIFQEGQEFNDRLFVTCRNLNVHPSLKPIDHDYGRPEERIVALPSFGSFACSLAWDIPEQFRAISTPSPPSAWPWGQHHTELLGHLAAAAERFWKLYDPTDPTTAPTNELVAGWLVERGVADRVAQVIAQILRAEGLPAGRRR